MPQTLFDEKINDLRTQSLGTIIEHKLEHMILDGEIQPGERINESSLAQSFGVSRAPIREACRKLAQYGLVENRVGKGSFVCQVDLSVVIELYEIRGMLDAYAVEQVCLKADQAMIDTLGSRIEDMRILAKRDTAAEYLLANLAFHLLIVEYACNKSLVDIYRGVFKKLTLFRNETLSVADRRQISMGQHEQIFQAISDRDAQEASRLARNHVEEAKNVLLERHK
ncbi:GntR family transcriptional regulator [Reinekea forsetii]|nr:GntR family transcriptional regulator [Reinekea forsetii]